MSIRFYCPSGHRLNVSEKHAGETIRCSRCKQKVVVPASSSSNSTTETKETEQAAEHKAEEAVGEPDHEKRPASEPTTGKSQSQPELGERKKSRSKPPPLPVRKLPAVKDDPTQPKQKPVPKVEIPEQREAGHDDESVLDSEAPRLKDRSKPQRTSRLWADSKSAKVPPEVPPKVSASDASSSDERESPGKSKKPPEPPEPAKTEPARREAESEGELREQEVAQQQAQRSRLKERRDRRRSKRKKRDEMPEADTPRPELPEPDAAQDRTAQEPTPQRTPRRRGPKMMPPNVYQADRGSLATVRGLALILGLAVLFSLLPVGWLAVKANILSDIPWSRSRINLAVRLVFLVANLETAPGWARAVFLVAAIQLFYIAWMVTAPDWAGVWVVMVVFALVATAYGTATAMAVAWPVERPIPLGMGEDLRTSAKYWCGSVLAVMSLATYLCGRISAKWRRTCELELAGRQRPGQVR